MSSEVPFENDPAELAQEPAPQPSVKGKYTWVVYFKSKEGFGESITVETTSAKELQSARTGTIMYLQMNGAETQPRDKEGVKTGGWGRQVVGQAGNGNSNTPPPAPAQPGIAPVCPLDGGAMVMKPAGIQGPNSPNPGRKYPAFWSCVNFPACRGRANA